MTENEEDAGTLAYLEDTASQAGLQTTLIGVEDIGLREDGNFVDLDDTQSNSPKLYPRNGCFTRVRRKTVERADTLDRTAMEGDPLARHPSLL
jgi:glutathionylspermidine synthase